MKVTVTTSAEATITETWEVEVPDDWNLDDPEIADRLDGLLFTTAAKFISERVDDDSEKDRQVMSWQHGKVLHSYDCYDTWGPRVIERTELP